MGNKCLQFGNYKFSLSYDMNDTLSNDISYSLQAGNKVIDEYESNEFIGVEEEFTVCSSNSDCLDYDGCTDDLCNNNSKICENIDLSICVNCKDISIELM